MSWFVVYLLLIYMQRAYEVMVALDSFQVVSSFRLAMAPLVSLEIVFVVVFAAVVVIVAVVLVDPSPALNA